MTTFLAQETDYGIEQIAQVIREQLAEQQYRFSDNLRTAVEYSPETMTVAEWVAACRLCNINEGTARNRFREVQLQRKALLEI